MFLPKLYHLLIILLWMKFNWRLFSQEIGSNVWSSFLMMTSFSIRWFVCLVRTQWMSMTFCYYDVWAGCVVYLGGRTMYNKEYCVFHVTTLACILYIKYMNTPHPKKRFFVIFGHHWSFSLLFFVWEAWRFSECCGNADDDDDGWKLDIRYVLFTA